MTNFAFLNRMADVHEAAAKAERQRLSPTRGGLLLRRRALELAVAWVYKHDPALHLPYQDNISALIHEPSFRQAVGEAVFNKAQVIKDLGNRAVHSRRPVRQSMR